MRRTVLVVVASLSTGCAVTRGRGIEDVRTEVERRAPVAVRWDQGTPEDERVRARVKELLSSGLSADAAVEVALLNNRRLQAVYEELGISQADLVEAGLLANPVLAATLDYGAGVRLAGGSIAQEFLSLLTLPMRKKLARAEWEQKKLVVAHAVLTLAADVRIAWFEAKAAEETAAMRRDVLSAAGAGAEIARRQFDAGNIGDLQLALEEERYEQVKLDLAEAEASVATSRERLHRLLGVWGAETAWTLAALPQIPPSEPVLDHLESVAIAQRLDLEADRKGTELVARALRTTRAWRFVPGLDVGVDVHEEDDGVTYAGPSLALTVPLFNWGQTRIARLESQLRKAENELVAGAIEIRSDVREARDRMLRARARVVYYRETLLPLRRRIVSLTQLRYNAMLLGVYDLLRAKESEIDARREFIDANRDYWTARTELERAIGGSLPREVAK